MERKYQVCTKCVMDTTDANISFDEHGVCDRCREYEERILPSWNHGKGHEQELAKLLADIKRSGQGKEYDCILGLSGGLDSTYMLHLAVKEWGLRPFVFHIDAGWDLPVAKDNIRKVTEGLGVKLHNEVMDWNEMREMQLAWFRTGMENLDSSQDHAFIAVIDKYSRKLGVKYILNGYNIATEVVSDPASWGQDGGPTGDSTFMKDVIKKYCKIPIKHYTFTNGFLHKFWIPYVLGIKTIKPLNLVPVTKKQMVETLGKEYGKIENFVKEYKPENIRLLRGLPKADYDKLVAACDVGTIFLDHRFTIPNFPSRLLSYMQARLPVLCCTDPNTDVGRIAEQNGFGWWCESNDVAAFGNVVQQALQADLQQMGENGWKYLLKEYTVEKSYKTIMRIQECKSW